MQDPNKEQEQIMINNGLIPENWKVDIDGENTIEVVSKHTFRRRKISKSKIKDGPLTMAEIENRNTEDRRSGNKSRILTVCKMKCLKCGNEYPVETGLYYCNTCGSFLYMQQEVIIPKTYKP